MRVPFRRCGRRRLPLILVVITIIGIVAIYSQEYRMELHSDCQSQSLFKIIHQSWKDENLPPIFVKWSMTWKKQNPGYEYRLWTDDDNRRMIAQHYPWALAAYDGMPKNIQRADMARYFYMHRYGCVYADLDRQCLRPIDELLAYFAPCRDCIKNTAFLALMGSSLEWEHSLPNAWMASTPGHSF